MAAKKKEYYKIGEACKDLDIQPYVLRYWETEFSVLRPDKSKSGQRVYSEADLGIIRRIKELLYDEGFTIAGAKKRLAIELESKPRPTAAPGETESAAKSDTKPTTPTTAASKSSKKPKSAKQSASASKPDKLTKTKELDTKTTDELKQLRVGVQSALDEAREILALVDGSAG